MPLTTEERLRRQQEILSARNAPRAATLSITPEERKIRQQEILAARKVQNGTPTNSAKALFEQIKSGKIIPGKHPVANKDWTSMYIDGKPTETQKQAYSMWEGYLESQDKVPQMKSAITKRNYEKEANIISKLGFTPQTEEELALAAKMTYSQAELAGLSRRDRINLGLEQEKTSPSIYNPEQLRQMGFSEKQIQSLAMVGEEANRAFRDEVALGDPNVALGYLQEALNIRNNVTDQPLGVSELSKAAGLPTEGVLGASTLGQELNMRSAEMVERINGFRKRVGEGAGGMRDVLMKYDKIQELFNKQKDDFLKVNEVEMAFNRQLQLLEKQYEFSREQKQFEIDLDNKFKKPSIAEQMKLYEAGISGFDERGEPILLEGDTSLFDAWLANTGNGSFTANSPFHRLKDGTGELDIAGEINSNVYSPVSGVVIEAPEMTSQAWGNYLVLEDNAGNLWRMAHFNDRKVREGDIVEAGQLVGLMGNTGTVLKNDGSAVAPGEMRGVHVHIEARDSSGKLINIKKFLSEGGTKLTPEEKSQGRALARELYGVNGIKEGVPDILRQMESGKTIDEVRDSIRYSNVSPHFTSLYRKAYNSLAIKGFTPPQLAILQAGLDDFLQIGDTKGANDFLLKASRDAKGVEQENSLAGMHDTIVALNYINKKIEELVSKGGKTSWLAGKEEQIRQKVLGQTGNKELAEIANEIAVTVMNHRRSYTGAAFSIPEAESYALVFPDIDKNIALNQAKIDSLKNIFTIKLEGFYKRQLGEDVYNQLFKSVPDAKQGEIIIKNKIRYQKTEGGYIQLD